MGSGLKNSTTIIAMCSHLFVLFTADLLVVPIIGNLFRIQNFLKIRSNLYGNSEQK